MYFIYYDLKFEDKKERTKNRGTEPKKRRRKPTRSPLPFSFLFHREHQFKRSLMVAFGWALPASKEAFNRMIKRNKRSIPEQMTYFFINEQTALMRYIWH